MYGLGPSPTGSNNVITETGVRPGFEYSRVRILDFKIFQNFFFGFGFKTESGSISISEKKTIKENAAMGDRTQKKFDLTDIFNVLAKSKTKTAKISQSINRFFYLFSDWLKFSK
jgi:hypothetical protein